jgi:iron complex transport system ATP-binding protein
MSTILSTENLSVALGGKTVLDDVTLDLQPGGLIGLVGPNGAGKSTMLRAMARLTPPSHGVIRLDGRDIAGMEQAELARGIAYLPQGHVVHWSLSVDEVVGLARLPHRGRFASISAADRRAIQDAMKRADILSFAGRSVESLSGGERSRVMLARALAVEAPVLLVDEPVTSLDPYHQLHVMTLLRDMARTGSLILVVLHELPLAARFCSRLILLDRGKIAASGDPESVLSQQNLARVYGVHGLHGREDDESFVLAWRRLESGGGISF